MVSVGHEFLVVKIAIWEGAVMAVIQKSPKAGIYPKGQSTASYRKSHGLVEKLSQIDFGASDCA